MDSWRWMFDACRVPGLGGKDFRTVVFIRKNKFWKVDASVDHRLLSTAEWERQIQHIYDNSMTEYPPVGILTSNNRDTWAKDYDLLSASERNKRILNEIESSAFVVCLDSEKPETDGGELGNRWVDKPVQFIVWDNAKAGIMGEHSVMDGTPTAVMSGSVVAAIKKQDFDHGSPSISANLSFPQSLDFEVDTEIDASITIATNAARVLINSHILSFLRTSYGKRQIKVFGFSPDTCIPSAHRWPGKLNGGTYEAATTRKFQHGRTETIRVVSEESVKWCESIDSGSVDREEVKALFKEACHAHRACAREAGNAQGVDRVIFGMQQMRRPGEEVPELFTDNLFQRSKHWVLSTSAIYNPNFRVYGWGEVVPDGFGVAYVAGFDEFLQFTVTSRKDMPNHRFTEEIDRAAEDLRALFQDEGIATSKL
ncbi:acyltransferase ChoActase/COT/CPT [Cantharellus anzutake]|uniref:acyltransferase ChoActase/COT/CPT n=1 Tax=Cantharellus anzutake TaxID=1750568 RepID=UPI001905A268|nr:acyltransferase ChoActase/COT/CPT [Cantharellus anzutake]KAF8329449.1 acyltransferase ChoActase/COT/CPT [Cantharellus anzutake]